MIKQLPSRELVQQLLDYNCVTGELIWKPREGVHKTWTTRYANKPAGKIGRYNRTIGILGNVYQVSHIVWLHYHGEPVPDEIDHKDRNQLNCAIDNLREATRSQNNANKGLLRNNTSGVKGVNFHQNRWVARVHDGNKEIYLGRFVTLEEAMIARQKAFVELYGEYARHE